MTQEESRSSQRNPEPDRQRPSASRRGRQQAESRWLQYFGAILLPIVLGVGTVMWTELRAADTATIGEKAINEEKKRKEKRAAPVKVRIEESWNNDTDHWWVFGSKLTADDITRLNNAQARRKLGDALTRLVAERDGTRFSPDVRDPQCTAYCGTSSARFQLRLTGNREVPIQLVGIRAVILSRQEPPAGGLIGIPPGGLIEA